MNILRRFAHNLWRSVSETAFVWINEINLAFRDEAVWVFMILVPLGYPLLYSYIYNNEVVRDIPVAVVDMDHSALSREYTRNLDASEYANVTQQPADLATAKKSMMRTDVYAIVYIPSDFSKNINTGKTSYVYVFNDASTLLYYRQLAIASTAVSIKMNGKIKVMEAGNTTDRQDELTVAPVKYQEVDIFVPQMGLGTFLLPAVLILILQQTMLLGVGVVAGTMREKNMFRLYAPIARHAGGTFQIALGRTLCYIPLYVANTVFVLGITPRIFNFTRLSHLPDMIAFMLPFLLAVAFMAQVLAYFVKRREACMMLVLFSSLIFLFMSGISWPGSAVPPFWKILAYFFPSTMGINGFVRMTNEGARLSQVSFEYGMLWAQALFYMLLSMWLMKKDIRKSCALFNKQHRHSHRQAPLSPAVAYTAPVQDEPDDAQDSTQRNDAAPDDGGDKPSPTPQNA